MYSLEGATPQGQEEGTYRALFDHMLNGFAFCRMVFDGDEPVDFVYLDVNEAFRELTGLRDVVGKRVTEVIPGFRESDRELLQRFGRVARTGPAERFEVFVKGLSAWFDISAYCPRPGCFVAVFDVITARKRTEAALVESESYFRAMFEVAPIGMAQAEPQEGRFVRVNTRMCQITGYSADELLAMRVRDLTHPDDRERDSALFQGVVRGEAPEYRIEKRYVRKDGGTTWVRVNMTVIRDPSGTPVRTMATIEEITARKADEARLRLQTSALQAAANGIVITDRAGTVRWVNAAFEKLTGYSEGEIVGQSSRRLSSGKQAPLFYQEMWRTILAGDVWRGELVNLRKDGSLYDEDMTITPVLDEHGAVAHFVGIKQDISARKRAETAQRETEQQLRAVQKMEAVGRLAGGVAHDFNNVLSVILSYTVLAVGDLKPDDPLRADLEEVVKAAKRAEELTRQLLTFSRRQILKAESIDLNALIAGLAKMLRRLIGEDIELDIRPGESLSATHADRGQIEQVLMNLLVNSRDAMPKGGTIRVSTSNVALEAAEAASLEVPAGEYVELRVADTGCGMEEVTRSRVFEPFFTTKGVGQGTGLGLAMVYGIVRQSAGGVTVESAPGKGATFRIVLPRGDLEVVPKSSKIPPARIAPGRECVLVVDDEEALRNVVRRVLAAAGYEVLVAASGDEALLACRGRTGAVDLVLTDVVMPGMSGRELAQELATVCPAAKVIYMSGYTDDAIARHDLLEVDLIRKPFELHVLTERVRRALDGA